MVEKTVEIWGIAVKKSIIFRWSEWGCTDLSDGMKDDIKPILSQFAWIYPDYDSFNLW
jgi:hypothetical protein